MTYSRLLYAPMLLLLWQVAPPLDFKPDARGRVRLSIGTGEGAFSFKDLAGFPGGVDCFGNGYGPTRPRTRTETWKSTGGSAQVWVRRDVRVQAAMGRVTALLSETDGFRTGTFGGAQVILDRKSFGLGAGLAALGLARGIRPSLSARVGPLDGFSLFADYNFPDAMMGLRGGPRAGAGFNQGPTHKLRVLFGASTTPAGPPRKYGAFLDVAAPLVSLFGTDLGVTVSGFVAGTYKGNEQKVIGSVAIGAWLQP